MITLCSSAAAAAEAMRRMCQGRPSHLLASMGTLRGTVVGIPFATIQLPIWKEELVAFGVYYQVPSKSSSKQSASTTACFDFWGFVPGNVVRLSAVNVAQGEKILLRREWFAPTIEEVATCHASFDMYASYEISDEAKQSALNLDEIDAAIASRCAMYAAISDRGYMPELLVRWRDVLYLRNPEAVRIDKLGYFLVLAFLSNLSQASWNSIEHRARLDAWRKIETSLAMFRVTHCMSTSGPLFASRLKGSRFEHVMADDLMFDSDEEKAAAAHLLPAGSRMLKIPFEAAIELVAKREVFLRDGFVYVDSFYVFNLLVQQCRDNHIANEVECATAAKHGGLDGIFGEERLRAKYDQFLPRFSNWVKSHAPSASVVSVASPADALDARNRLRAILASTPECMTAIVSRAISVKDKAHNKHPDRLTFSRFMLRMNAPMDLLKPLIKAKVFVSYEDRNAETEWKSIQVGLDWDKKNFRKPGEKPFVPPCWWIINGGKKGPSRVECPYATRTRSKFPALAADPRKLFEVSTALCHGDFLKSNELQKKDAPYAASGPDEYTLRMIARQETLRKEKSKLVPTKAAAAAPSKRKAEE